jgi:hypothetical protein
MASITLSKFDQELSQLDPRPCSICLEKLFDKQPESIVARIHVAEQTIWRPLLRFCEKFSLRLWNFQTLPLEEKAAGLKTAKPKRAPHTTHMFHKECISTWAKGTEPNHGTCPECRRPYGGVEYYQYNKETGEYVPIEGCSRLFTERPVQPSNLKSIIAIISCLFSTSLSLSLLWLLAFAQPHSRRQSIALSSLYVVCPLNALSILFLKQQPLP